MARPSTTLGLLAHVLLRAPRRRVLLLGAGALVGLTCAQAGMIGDDESGPWTQPFYGDEIVADDEHVYWTESRDREYDDRPIAIARAAVRRRPHGGGSVDTLFDFERDDTYCFPGSLRFMDGRPAWHCARPILDGDGRADPSRYVHVRDGALHEVPAPWAQPHMLAAWKADAVFLVTSRGARLVTVDVMTGRTREGPELPAAYRSFSATVAGMTAEHVVGAARDDEGPFLWSTPRESDRPPRVVHRLASNAQVRSATAGARDVFVSWSELSGPSHLMHVEGEEVRELLVASTSIGGLLAHGDHLYFHQGREIRRLHLATSEVETVVSEAQPGSGERSIAVGGGYVYWRASGGLHRRRLGSR